MKNISISDFLNKNQAILVTMAVFVALAEVSTSYFIDSKIGHSFAGLFLGMVILLGIELFRNFPKAPSDFLDLFRAFLGLALGSFTLYWILYNVAFIIYMLAGVVIAFVLATALLVYKRLRYGKSWKDHI